MLPNFIIIGVSKCGTTTLYNSLKNHPQIFVSQPKEPNYFNKTINYRSTRGEYEKLFEHAGSFPFRGESSVGYTNPSRIHFVPKRIHEAIPDCKLIFMVRHPIKRLESEWKMRLRLNNTANPDFLEELQYNIKMYNHGLYWETLSQYLEYFRKEQILTVFMEDLHNSFDTEIFRVLTHIGADTVYKLSSTHSNSSANYRKDTGYSALLKEIFGNRIKSRIPASIKNKCRGLITKDWDYGISWNAEIYAEVAQYFAEDSQALLEYCGKSHDFWDFNYPGEK